MSHAQRALECFCLECWRRIGDHNNPEILSKSRGLIAVSLLVHWQDQAQLLPDKELSYVEDDFHLEIDEDIYHQCVLQITEFQEKNPAQK